jgi:hypothetical protein
MFAFIIVSFCVMLVAKRKRLIVRSVEMSAVVARSADGGWLAAAVPVAAIIAVLLHGATVADTSLLLPAAFIVVVLWQVSVFSVGCIGEVSAIIQSEWEVVPLNEFDQVGNCPTCEFASA